MFAYSVVMSIHSAIASPVGVPVCARVAPVEVGYLMLVTIAPAYLVRETVTPYFIRALTYCVACSHGKVAELSGVEVSALNSLVSYEVGAWEFEATPTPHSMLCAVCRVQLVRNVV